MTRLEYRIIFTALGYLATILNDTPKGKEASRATTISNLIEAFCLTQYPSAFGEEYLSCSSEAQLIRSMVDRYLKQLRDEDAANLDFDRATLLEMYEVLTVRHMQSEQREFYKSAPEDLIANRVLQMASELIRREES